MNRSVLILMMTVIVAMGLPALGQEAPNMEDPAMAVSNLVTNGVADIRNAAYTGESSAVACCEGQQASTEPLLGRMRTGRTGSSTVQDGNATQ